MSSQVTASGFTFKRLEQYDRAAAASNSNSSLLVSPPRNNAASLMLELSAARKPPSTVFAIDAAVETEGATGVRGEFSTLSERDALLLQKLSAARQRDELLARHQPQVRHPLLVKSHVEFTPVALSALLRHSAVEQLDRRVQRLDHIEKVTEGLSPTHQPRAGSASAGRRSGSPMIKHNVWGGGAGGGGAFRGGNESPMNQPLSAPSPIARQPLSASSGRAGRALQDADFDEELPEAALRFHQLREEYLGIRRMFRDSQARSVSTQQPDDKKKSSDRNSGVITAAAASIGAAPPPPPAATATNEEGVGASVWGTKTRETG